MAMQASPQESSLYGTAQLFTGGYDIAAAFKDGGSTMIPLGHNPDSRTQGMVLDLGPDGNPGHALTFGATRSGKGVNVINVALLTYTGSVVAIDPKGELAWISGEFRRKIGQRVVILDPWDEVNKRYGSKVGVSEHITKFNPLSGLDPTSDDFADDVAAIADALIIPSKNQGDSHWTESARELVAGLVAAVVENAPGVGSLREVREMLTAMDEDLAQSIVALQAKNPDSIAGRKLRRFTKATQEISGIRSTAETQTALLDSEKLMNALETDEVPFDLEELAKGKVTIYLVLPPDRLQTHGRWMRLLLTLTIRTIARQATPPPLPVLFMLDEMGTIGALSMIEQSYGLMAGLGIRLWGFLQDLPQLQRDYPLAWETFISNSSIIQVLNVGDQTTAKYVSEYLGNKTIEVNKGFSKHTRPNTENSDPIDPNRPKSVLTAALARAAGGMGHNATGFSQTEVWEPDLAFHGRPLLFPWEVRAVPKSASLIMVPGIGNAQLDRFTYYSDPVFSARARHDPNKPAPRVETPLPSPAPAWQASQPPPAYRPPSPQPSASDVITGAAEKLGGFLDRLKK